MDQSNRKLPERRLGVVGHAGIMQCSRILPTHIQFCSLIYGRVRGGDGTGLNFPHW